MIFSSVSFTAFAGETQNVVSDIMEDVSEEAGEEKEEIEKEEVSEEKEEAGEEKEEAEKEEIKVETVEEDTVAQIDVDEVIEKDENVTLESVQAMLDHLPDEVTDENFDDVMLQIEAIDEALEILDSEQLEKLDYSKYLAIGNLLAGFAIINTDFPAQQELELVIPIKKVVKGINGEPVDGTFSFNITKEYMDIPEVGLQTLDAEIDVNLLKQI